MICAIAELESDRQPLATRYNKKTKETTVGIMQIIPKTTDWLFRKVFEVAALTNDSPAPVSEIKATIPLTRLKKFYKVTSVESLRRIVKRLVDQAEQNVEFVQKKRDEVAFSPKDHEVVETFLQLEKGLNAPFSQYYKSVIEKASVRIQKRNEKLRSQEQKESKRKRGQLQKTMVNGEVDADKVEVRKADSKGKKRRVSKV